MSRGCFLYVLTNVNHAVSHTLPASAPSLSFCHQMHHQAAFCHSITTPSGTISKIMLKQHTFFIKTLSHIAKCPYLCNVFFMVLDLRLTKVGCRETINFFCTYLIHRIRLTECIPYTRQLIHVHCNEYGYLRMGNGILCM